MIRCEFTEDFSLLNSEQYLELFDSSSVLNKSYFNHPEFLFICLNAFSKTDRCFLFSVFDDDALVGFEAFRKTNLKLRGIKLNILVPAGFRIAEYNMPVVNSAYYSDFFQQLSSATKKESIFYHNATGFYTEWFTREVKGAFVYSVSPNPVLRNTEKDILKASLKKGIVRDYKSLHKKTTTEIQHLKGNIRESILDEFFDLHIKRWESRGVESKFQNSVYRNVYQSLCKLKIEKYGQNVLSFVRSDGKLLATHLGFIVGDSFLYQIPAFDVTQKSKSPGTVLLKSILDFIVNENLSVFDMGYGMEEYKFRYMNDVVNYFSVARFSNPFYQKFFKVKM